MKKQIDYELSHNLKKIKWNQWKTQCKIIECARPTPCWIDDVEDIFILFYTVKLIIISTMSWTVQLCTSR